MRQMSVANQCAKQSGRRKGIVGKHLWTHTSILVLFPSFQDSYNTFASALIRTHGHEWSICIAQRKLPTVF